MMLRTSARSASLGALLTLIVPGAAPAAPPKSRSFTFTYAGAVTGLPHGETARVWLPVPPTDADQDARIVRENLPAEARPGTERTYGDKVLYFAAKTDADGRVPFEVVYAVTRREVRGDAPSGGPMDAAALDRYLRPDAKVPIDGKPLELIKGRKLPKDETAAARVLYDTVNGHMRYSKEGTGWGRGDSAWACDSGRGNCSDFHSLFISLARSRKIPAKFEIGFPLPEKRGAGEVTGYHCWAKFKPAGKGWIPVDISEANKNPALRDYYFGNLSENRVCCSTGRDLELVPRQDGPPLNFFVDPYVEVGGKPYPEEKVRKRYSFADKD